MRLPSTALAVASVCAAHTALAQSSNIVTLYGRAYALLESVEVRDKAATVMRRQRITNQSSIVGLRAHEDLGGGLAAWVQLETALPLDEPAATFANRNSAIGLSGPWGTFLAGRWDSAFEQSQVGVVDPFNDLGLPDITGAAINQGNFARRQQNVVQYWSPSWAGFQAKVNYAVNELRTAGENAYEYGGSLTFNDGVLYVAFAFEKHRDQVGMQPTRGFDEEGIGFAAFRRFGPVKIEGQYGRYRKSGTTTQSSYSIGYEADFDAHALLGIYQKSRNGGAVTLASQPRCDLWGLGYRYSFSARTFLIAEYAKVNNKAGALCNFGSNPVEITSGQDLQGFAAGLRIIF
jgi:predicted porin